MRAVSLFLAIALCTSACDRPQPDTSASDTPRAGESSAPKEAAPRAPEVFQVRFETSKGPFVIQAHRNWAPNGVDRFHQLVTSGFFDNARFFRVVPGFVVQFGLNGEPDVSRAWDPLRIPDDPVVQSNRRGMLSFASAGPNTRTTQLFINFGDNTNLDAMGFAPIGVVTQGMDVVDRIHSGYGEAPDQARIKQEGNAYLEREFPQLDFIRTARIVTTTATDSAGRAGNGKT